MANQTNDKLEGTPRLIQIAATYPLAVSGLGAALLWLAFPPVGLWPLAWVALVPWFLLASVKVFHARRPRLKIWLASFGYWLAALYFIPIPHWALWFGWILMALYLSIYLPLVVWAVGTLVQQSRWPLWIAAPLAFVSCEWLRGNLITGFAMISLGHSQFKLPVVIQISDLIGGYGLSLMMAMFSAMLLSSMISHRDQHRMWSVSGTTCIVLAIVIYGVYRLTQPVDETATLRALIIQGSVDTLFPATAEEAEEYRTGTRDHYIGLHEQAFNQLGTDFADVVLWPEGKYPELDLVPLSNPASVDAATRDWVDFMETRLSRTFFQLQGEATGEAGIGVIPMLVGGQTFDPVTEEVFNSALLIELGHVSSRYHKVHRVIFGEYVPLQDWFPVLGEMTPIGKGLAAGRSPRAMAVAARREFFDLAPSICFESSVPHLIRRQINQLSAAGTEPDVLVNLTDDGWFFGTALLDHHLACNVFRAVELRKPMLVAANTGLSAHIDGSGRLVQVGPRRREAWIQAEVSKDDRNSLYRVVGDWPVMIIGLICAAGLLTQQLRHPPGR